MHSIKLFSAARQSALALVSAGGSGANLDLDVLNHRDTGAVGGPGCLSARRLPSQRQVDSWSPCGVGNFRVDLSGDELMQLQSKKAKIRKSRDMQTCGEE